MAPIYASSDAQSPTNTVTPITPTATALPTAPPLQLRLMPTQSPSYAWQLARKDISETTRQQQVWAYAPQDVLLLITEISQRCFACRNAPTTTTAPRPAAEYAHWCVRRGGMGSTRLAIGYAWQPATIITGLTTSRGCATTPKHSAATIPTPTSN